MFDTVIFVLNYCSVNVFSYTTVMACDQNDNLLPYSIMSCEVVILKWVVRCGIDTKAGGHFFINVCYEDKCLALLSCVFIVFICFRRSWIGLLLKCRLSNECPLQVKYLLLFYLLSILLLYHYCRYLFMSW